jgi:hypothetical protein
MSTPIKNQRSSTYRFSSASVQREEEYAQPGLEMTHSIVGPMPPKEFLDEFFPTITPHCPFEEKDFNNTVSAEGELQMYDRFVSFSHHAP